MVEEPIRTGGNPRCPFHEGPPFPNNAFEDADVVQPLGAISRFWRHWGNFSWEIWRCPKCRRIVVIGTRAPRWMSKEKIKRKKNV